MSESTESPLKTAIAVLPVLSAGLYLLGTMHHEGYLSAFGLEQSMFPLAIDRLLLLGFIELLGVCVAPNVYAVVAMLVLIAAVLLAGILSSVPQVQHWQAVIAQRRRKFLSNRAPSSKVDALLDKSSNLYIYVTGSLLVVVLLLVVALVSARSGKEQAEHEIADFSAGKSSYLELSAEQVSSPKRAKQIICGATYCAFWLGTEAMVLRTEQIKQIVTHND